jgi:hypothetical protein
MQAITDLKGAKGSRVLGFQDSSESLGPLPAGRQARILDPLNPRHIEFLLLSSHE